MNEVWVWLFIAGWIGFIVGFFTAALMAAASQADARAEAMRSAGLNDD